ncbi:MAG: dicarboxylate/amino acid:cation symporter [Bacteroidota bacterium]
MNLSWKAIPLHHKILAALILGALFGAIFSVSKYELTIRHEKDRKAEQVDVVDWATIEFLRGDEMLASFGSEDQLKIIRYFRKLPSGQRADLRMRVTTEEVFMTSPATRIRDFENIKDVDKVTTIAVRIKPIGTIFIRLLMFVAIPLVLASLIAGAASLGDIARVGRLGGKTITWYLATTIVAITIGLLAANIIQPGKQLSAESRDRLSVEFEGDIAVDLPPVDVVEMIVNIVAPNPIKALAEGQMLQIVFFALMIGISLTLVRPEKSKPVIDFFEGLSETMIRMVELIMKIAPYGVFALIATTVAEFGFDILGTLAWYAFTLLLGLALHMFGVIGLGVRAFAGIPYRKFYSGIKEAMLVGFTTSSSGATLPVNMRVCEANLGVPKQVAGFVLPLGATINMDGTSMYQGVAAVFIAQVYGLDLSLAEQLTIVFTALLASIGTAPVPGVGLIMLVIVLRSVNIPEQGIALILGVDRILDMCRTATNVTGDAAIASVIAKQEGLLESRP